MIFAPENIKKIKQVLKPSVIILMSGLALAAVIKPVNADNQNATVKGTVYQDKNENGVQDENEQGIPNVTVSDGKTLSVTDEKGNYHLIIDTERRVNDIVFVSVPNGYSVPTDENKTPQFYKQLGSIKPDETREQHFGLLHTPATSNPNFSFANVADVHVQAGTTNNRERFTEQLAQINQSSGNPAFIAVSGDLTNRATDTEFQDYTASTATSTLPVYPAVGNHDFAPGSDYKTRIDRYREYLGPEWYSFDYGNRHFITLENTLGFNEADQLEWLKQDLAQNAKNKEVVVFVHKPLNTPQTPSPDKTKEFIDLLSQYQTRLVMVGHTHVNDVAQDTIPGANHVTTVSSSYTIDQMPNGFRMVNFQGGKQDQKFKMYDVKESASIVHPAAESDVPKGEVDVLVNAYNTTSTVTKVEYRIDGSPWEELKQSSGMAWFEQWDAKNAEKGKHAIEVRVTDDSGKVWSKNHTFNIVDSSERIAPKSGSDWTMFHGNAQHTGMARDTLEAGLRLDWTYQTQGTILTSSPAIANGLIYIGTRDENSSEHHAIHAVNLETGEKVWQVKADAQVQASPAVVDGIVYASSIRGTLYAINAQNGEIIWQKTMGKDEVQRAWMYYSPTAADGVVYQAYSTGNGGKLMALDAKTGKELWIASLAGNWIVESTPVVENGKVYVGGDGGWLISLDASTGKELWRKKPAGGWMHSMPSISEGKLYMGYQGGLLVVLDAATGKELWRYKSNDSSYIHGNATGSSPAIADGIVYMGFPDGNVAALDATTGTLKWSYRTKGGIISSAAISGETIYIGSNDGNLYGLDRLTGQPLWQHEIGAWVASSPAISGNTLVVGALDGNLYAFTPGGKAEQRWPRVTGKITDSETGKPVPGTTITIINEQGEKVRAGNTDQNGNYLIAVEPGNYQLHASRLSYQTNVMDIQLAQGDLKKMDISLAAVSVDAGVGKTISGPTSQGTMEDIVMENSKLAMAIADTSEDSQLPGVTKGKPIDFIAKGMTDQIDWFNLPYASKTMPTGPDAWQQLTVESDKVEVVEVTTDRAVVKATGKSLDSPTINAETTFTIETNQEWITANTVFSNTGNETQALWIGDAIDYDGSGQKSGVGGHHSITLSYSNPQEFKLSEPWIGMTGNDKQVYGLVYSEDSSELIGYGNGNWIMSQKKIELPAGESYTLKRKIVVVNANQSDDPFAELSALYHQNN
jgi:outer membrane protein assembly factor BamB/predicted MPP superfamily phosphohydrolase